MSTVTIYIPKDNGDLKYVADVEDEDRPDMALDAVLDEIPNAARQSDTFVAVVDGLEDGKVVLLTLGGEEVLRRPKRAISMSNGAGTTVEETVEEEPVQPARRRGTAKSTTPRRRGRPPKAQAEESEDEAPAPRRRATAAKKTPAKRGGSGRKTPFTRNAKSDD